MVKKKGEVKIQIKDLNLYYSDFHALKNINMDIRANRITALIGPSGCGKSTLLRTLNRINDTIDGVRITGEILINGKNIYGEDMQVDRVRKEVGMVFQRPNPFPLSIYNNIAFGLEINRMVKSIKETDKIVLLKFLIYKQKSHSLEIFKAVLQLDFS